MRTRSRPGRSATKLLVGTLGLILAAAGPAEAQSGRGMGGSGPAMAPMELPKGVDPALASAFAPMHATPDLMQIGRASCRERV